MDSTFAGKKFIVVGAASIGSPVIETLLRKEARVLVIRRRLLPPLGLEYQAYLKDGRLNWCTTEDLRTFHPRRDWFDQACEGLIYTAGADYKEDESAVREFSFRNESSLKQEFNSYVIQLHWMLQQVIQAVAYSGKCVIFGPPLPSSVAEDPPIQQQQDYHSLARVAQRELIRRWAQGAYVKARKIVFHHLTLCTPDESLNPRGNERISSFIPTPTIVNHVLRALESTESIDEMIMPVPSTSTFTC